ncbi:hypothetical protein OQ968_06710 [Mycobacterium sp. 663a-19]|nr:hypothetical protein [Mycobacterium sp. 663a-19]MEB3980950.1 hypothetical protein [Mycobacterium sp. 663a-19]
MVRRRGLIVLFLFPAALVLGHLMGPAIAPAVPVPPGAGPSPMP